MVIKNDWFIPMPRSRGWRQKWNKSRPYWSRFSENRKEEIIIFVEKKGGKISAQPHTIVKQISFPNSNVLFLSLFALSKNWMHNVRWGCAEIFTNMGNYNSFRNDASKRYLEGKGSNPVEVTIVFYRVPRKQLSMHLLLFRPKPLFYCFFCQYSTSKSPKYFEIPERSEMEGVIVLQCYLCSKKVNVSRHSHM